MVGIGTLINTGAVLAGGGIGICLKNGMKQRVQDILMQSSGVAVIFIGLGGVLKEMLTISNGELQTKGTMLLVFSLVLGGFFGELINIEAILEQIGVRLKSLLRAKENTGFVDGFVNTSLVICVGAMAIVGSIQDGLNGDYSMLAVKSVLDFVIVLVFASTYGIGVLFSALAILLYEGSITLVTVLIGPFLGTQIISQLSFIGSALIFGIGINITFGKKLRVGNMLPALFGPLIYAGITSLL